MAALHEQENHVVYNDDGSFYVRDFCSVCGAEHATGDYDPDEPVYGCAVDMVRKDAAECCPWED